VARDALGGVLRVERTDRSGNELLLPGLRGQKKFRACILREKLFVKDKKKIQIQLFL